MITKKTFTLLTICLLSTLFIQQAFANESENLLEMMEIDIEHHHTRAGRSLASYPNIRIGVDYTHVTAGTTTFKNYIKNQLIPSIVNFYQASLKVKHPLTSKIKTTKSTLCGFTTPSVLKTGVNADIFFIINTASTSANWIAITTACALGTNTGVTKPLIVNIGINTQIMNAATTSDPLTHDLNINTIMHEFLHGFAVRGNLYDYFIDENGKKLKNHVKQLTINGESREVLDLPPLTKRLRAHYNCSTLPGIVMENDGGAHFERRYFAYDLMSTGGIIEAKFTEFDFGFLEGTGWYVPDYSYAEPYFFGKGEGCGFINNKCDPAKFKEFCKGSGQGCGIEGGAGGYCTDDSKSEGCRYIFTQKSHNCDNSKASGSTFASQQIYGRGLGSKCFSGTLSTSKSAGSQTTYCFTYTCLDSGKTLRVNFGKQTFDCKKEGPLKIFNYSGSVNCPDPVTFCNTIGKPTCPKSCMGQGTCVDGKCKCDSGYQGTNCAFTK